MAADMFVVQKKVKDFIQQQGCMTGGDVYPVLSEVVKKLCLQGVDEAKSSGRKTVAAKHINTSGYGTSDNG